MKVFAFSLIGLIFFYMFICPFLCRYLWGFPDPSEFEQGLSSEMYYTALYEEGASFEKTYNALMIPFEELEEMRTTVEGIGDAVSGFWDKFVDGLTRLFTWE